MCLFGRVNLKNKYAIGKQKKRIRSFMHKVELWLPTKTYNKLVNDSMANGGDVSQKAANVLYGRLNHSTPTTLVWPFTPSAHPMRDSYVEEILNRFIAPTVMCGISQDDLIMNALDCELNYQDICDCIQAMLDDGVLKRDGKNKLHFVYSPDIKEKETLRKYKNEKVTIKEVTQPTLFVKKINR